MFLIGITTLFLIWQNLDLTTLNLLPKESKLHQATTSFSDIVDKNKTQFKQM